MPTIATLTWTERELLCAKLLQEQVVDQRRMLHYWREIVHQPAQIDTGYIGQILVSLVTGLPGGGYRGKGLDLADDSEIKTANFLDSLDAKGATAPRWNFMENSIEAMEALLHKPALYLGSIDVTKQDKVRARVWRLKPSEHPEFCERYTQWIEVFAKPKLADPKRPYANFQLFPPRLASDDTYARHGGGNTFNALPALKIELENHVGASKILHAEESGDSGLINIKTFQP